VAVLAILHDLNLVLAYADDLLVLAGGRLAASGPVAATLTPPLIRQVFDIPARLIDLPGTGRRQLLLGPSAA
jgi:iron complex transport system ATP-binding protein